MRHSRMVLRAILVGLLAIAVVAIPGSDHIFGQGGTWSTKAPMPTARAYLGVGVVLDRLYAVGGFTGSSIIPTVEAYDPVTNTWTSKSPMPTARWILGVGVVNGVLYAVGGVTSGPSGISTVEAYNPVTDTWTTKAPLPAARQGLGVAELNGFLYAVGGSPGFGIPESTVYAYNPVTDTWTTKAPMLTARYLFGVGVVNGILYAVGGNTNCCTTTVEAYDPATDTWTTKAPLPSRRNVLQVGVVNGTLYAVGGQDSSRGLFFATVDAYDPNTDTWTAVNPMPTARSALGVGVVHNVLYAVGGVNGSGFLATNEAFTPVVLFAAFTAKVEITLASSAFEVNSTFTLGTGGSIAPLTQPVTVRAGTASITIPAGSFTQNKQGKLVFSGVINGIPVNANLTPLGGSSYSLKVDAAGVPNLPNSNPVTLGLTIGNNTGSLSINATFQ